MAGMDKRRYLFQQNAGGVMFIVPFGTPRERWMQKINSHSSRVANPPVTRQALGTQKRPLEG